MTGKYMMLAIYGPTVTGKTALAISLAKKYNGEIISADSRQVYRDLDIGTGKISFNSSAEKHQGYWIVDGVKIHGFDLVDSGKQFTAADFLKFVHTTMIRIIVVNKLPIIVGGTGFYIKALIDGIDSIGIPTNAKLRQKLEKLSVQKLYQKLYHINSDRAEAMNESDRANPRRLIRAIEITLHNISGFSDQVYTQYSIPNTQYLLLGLTAPNNYLYARADKWLQTRLEKGLIQEVNRLIRDGVDPTWLENLGLEYRWLTRFILGRLSQEKALERLKGDIHSLIRRQKTWFWQFPNIKLFDITKPNWQGELEKTVSLWYSILAENDPRQSPY